MNDIPKNLSIGREVIFHRTGFDSIHDASRLILKLDHNAPEYEFRLQAIIKRLIHIEKASSYQRIIGYVKHDAEFGIQTARDKAEFHTEQCNKPDEELITWNVATHKYVCVCREPIKTTNKCGACGVPLRHRRLKND